MAQSGADLPVSLTACAQLALRSLASEVPVTIAPLPAARADPALMQLVFAHLIDHAIRFTRGAVDGHVEVFAARVEDRAVVCVRDNGLGLECDADGAELGLVRVLVERHGGRVWRRVRRGEGSLVCLQLPPAPALPRLIDRGGARRSLRRAAARSSRADRPRDGSPDAACPPGG